MQLQIDYTARRENNAESEKILQENKDHINGQCEKVLQLLQEGKRLTVRDAMIEHGISSLPRRILDLKQKLRIEIKTRIINKRFVEYYLADI